MLSDRDSRLFALALGGMALLGIALLYLFPGSAEQDAPNHFLGAREAWSQPVKFVEVWNRPFYTLLFAGPAAMGLGAARIFALLIGLGVAWQTWKLARDLALPRAWLVVALLLGQPVFFQLYPDLLTEPTFALLFVIALRLHLAGFRKTAMLVASFLPLARPEGFFLGVLWGLWILIEDWRAIPSTLLLATGSVLWWLAALVITGDPLFILHNWPATWHQGVYGSGNLFSYASRALEFTGPLLVVPFLLGVILTIRSKRWMPVLSPVLLFFVLHSVFRLYGLFGEAGYPRYMVSVAPSLAVLTLAGWNALAGLAVPWFGAVVLAVSLWWSVRFCDALRWARDYPALVAQQDWLKAHPPALVHRFLWSNAYMGALAGRTFPTGQAPPTDRDGTLKLLRESPSGTLVLWDDQIGPDWYGVTAQEIAAEGYQLLHQDRQTFTGILPKWSAVPWDEPRTVELSVLYKP